jgi:hypothetical protein
MVNWFELMRQAQGGAGFDNLARQFGLRPEQVQLATAALMPAFAMGFQRNAMNPNAMMQLFQVMTAGHYLNFFDSATQAFSAQGRQEGQAMIDKLFGSDEVTRRVAQQAAQFSGIGTEVLNQLLPLVAALFAGGMYKVMLNQGSMVRSMTEAWQGSAAPSAPAASGNPWADLWIGWMTPGARADQAPKGTPSAAANPFETMMESFLSAASSAKPKPEKPEEPSSPMAAWGQMMEKGQEMQRQHLESLQAIFDNAWNRGPQGR